MNPVYLSVPVLGDLEKKWMTRCIDSGFVSSVGPLVGQFEEEFAAFVGARYAVAVASGTAAIHVALKMLGLEQGGRALVPDLTFIATVNPVLYCGAEPVLCDVLRDTWSVNPAVVRHLCSARQEKKPDVILPVHLYGCACDMPAVMEIARESGTPVVEDATEALGTRINGKHVGTFGDIGCFSFNGNKMITTGGGGMLVTDSEEYARRARHLVNQARPDPSNYIHDEAGFNYRMTNLTAALGLAQMERLPGLLNAKKSFAAVYSKAFSGYSHIQCHPEPEGVSNCFWLYSVALQNECEINGLIGRMGKDNIQTRRFFYPLHKQPFIRKPVWSEIDGKIAPVDRGNSDFLSGHGLNLPSSPEMTLAQQDFVIKKFLEYSQ